MGIKERKEREKNEHREIILKAASEIITQEGIENLSIRKIANKIEYSPAIIYHYFRNKEDIINILMRKGYEKIVDVLLSLEGLTDEPENKLKVLLKRYIYMALHMPDEYKTVMMNNSPQVLEHTSVLFEGASMKRKALKMLRQSVKDIYVNANKSIGNDLVELTTQIIWTATFGLAMRLIIEKDISEKQKEKLIKHHINLMEGMIIGNSPNAY